jgi:hypothetical protein
MTQRLSFKAAPWAIGAAAILLLAPIPQVNAAKLLEPDCQSFASWGMTLDKKKRWRLNSANKRLSLPAAYADPQFESLFGKSALDWSREDIKSASKRAKACGAQARKAKHGAERRAFGTIQISLKNGLGAALAGLGTTQKNLDQKWQALVALPPSTDGLRVLGALRRMGPGGALEPVDAEEEDGERVIIRVPQGNMVFTRSGAWIEGQGLKLKRKTGS